MVLNLKFVMLKFIKKVFMILKFDEFIGISVLWMLWIFRVIVMREMIKFVVLIRNIIKSVSLDKIKIYLGYWCFNKFSWV